jgi:hypothetical protein
MASFAIPAFNLDVAVWHHFGTDPDHRPAPDFVVKGNLANGRVAHLPVWQPAPPAISEQRMSSSLLIPKGTDIRDISCSGGPDVVEVPEFSGRFYWVTYVDDIAKGFDNEHRWAVLQKIYTYGRWAIYRWPSPIP